MDLNNKLFWRGTTELIKFWFFIFVLGVIFSAIGAGAIVELLSVIAILTTIITGAIILVSFSWTIVRTIGWITFWLIFSPLPFVDQARYEESFRELKNQLSDIWS